MNNADKVWHDDMMSSIRLLWDYMRLTVSRLGNSMGVCYLESLNFIYAVFWKQSVVLGLINI